MNVNLIKADNHIYKQVRIISFQFIDIQKFATSHLDYANKLLKIMSNDAILRFTKGNEALTQGAITILKFIRRNSGMNKKQ
jgi:hypothetical protein